MVVSKGKIIFLLPTISIVPVGGYKIVMQYANKMAEDGYDLTIAYAGFIWRFFQNKSLKEKCGYIKSIFYNKKKYSARNWFPLDKRINETHPLLLTFKRSLDADIYIATACLTAKYIAQYPDNRKKIYFIQGYESWDMNDEELNKTYSLPLERIVISKWLQELLNKKGYSSTLITNGFNSREFYLTIPIEKKSRNKISLLYHPDPLKGFPLALKALSIVHQQYDIEVEVFGSQLPAIPLPSWISFHLTPTSDKHLQINNECAIYVAASYSEGWGLTIGEAMMCGQAVVCTDNKGYLEMVKNGYNALVTSIGNANGLAQSIICLISNNQLRCQIAHCGFETIKQFDFEISYTKLKKIIHSS